MRSLLPVVPIVAAFLGPGVAFAGNQFVTAEAVRVVDDGQIVTSLSAGNEVQTDADGFISFEGQVLTSNGTTLPVTMRVQTAGQEQAPSLLEFAEATGRVSVTNEIVFSPLLDGVELEKSIYTTVDLADGAVGSIIITDDPLPAVAGWLAFAALASFTGISLVVLTDEDGPCGERLTATISADLDEMKGEVAVTCERQ